MGKAFAGASSGLVVLFLGAGSALGAPLDVRIDGVKARGETLFVSVQTAAQFMGEEEAASAVVADPQEGTMRLRFDVPPGAYAVRVWHDDDGNGVFDTNFLGRPRDGWAMSGRVRGRPTFDKARVLVEPGASALTLRMTYGR